MITELRKAYNNKFTQDKYESFKNFIANAYDYTPTFRLCETPVFIDHEMKKKLTEACFDICKTITLPHFKDLTKGAIKHPSLSVPNEDYHTRFLQMDFGICENEDGEIVPQLIELQGFPSLYFFQDLLSQAYKKIFDIPTEFTVHFGELDSQKYIELLRKIIVGNFDPRHVVLLEIEPEKQVTQIDFLGARRELGIKILCISQIRKKGKSLYYKNEEGIEVPIKRIYNRVIFDELMQRPDLEREFYFHDEVDVEWVGHPNWFYRISKYTMPIFESQYVPDCYYLETLDHYPVDLENYVLKPLYSFAGSGVKIHITAQDLEEIKDKSNFILQRKVKYQPIIETPTGPAKFEIRMLMLWEQGEKEVRIVNNLVRISKGEMVGVRYNKDKDWVGASVAFFRR